MRHTSRRLTVLAIVASLPACAGEGLTGALGARTLPAGTVSVSRPHADPSTPTPYGGVGTPVRLVVRGAEQWRSVQATLWRGGTPPDLGAIDFRRNMIVVAALGARPTGGYGIYVDSARSSGRVLTLFVRSVSPGRTCVVTSAFTAPLDVALLPQTSEQVRFVESQQVLSC